MNRSAISNSSSRYHSTISKNSDTSVSSILRDSSAHRPKKQHSVRFEDSPIQLEKTIHINLSVFCSRVSSPSPSICSPVPSYCQSPKSKTRNPNNNKISHPLSTNVSISSPAKQSPVKAYSVQSVQESHCENSQVVDPKFGPKLLNYSFRNNGFYEKLNKFYEKPAEEKVSSAKGPSMKISITLAETPCNSSFLEGKEEKTKVMPAENMIIHLKPCLNYQETNVKEREARIKSLSPTRQSKPNIRKRNHHGATILN